MVRLFRCLASRGKRWRTRFVSCALGKKSVFFFFFFFFPFLILVNFSPFSSKSQKQGGHNCTIKAFYKANRYKRKSTGLFLSLHSLSPSPSLSQ